MKRRDFVKVVPLVGAGTVLAAQSLAGAENRIITDEDSRSYWVHLLGHIAHPLLDAGHRQALKNELPVETTTGKKTKPSTYLEGVGRLLTGMAPWLELEDAPENEAQLHEKYRSWARATVSSIVNPVSPDYLFDHMEAQMLVDAAFLAHAFIRAPQQLWQKLDHTAQQQVITAFRATRKVKPYYSNWLLFSAMIEAFFLNFELDYDVLRLDLPVKKHQEWYLGDGMYGDGPDFHWDYYNSFVIQPMLMDITRIMHDHKLFPEHELEIIARRFTRYAAIQERLISPEGTYPVIGRSVCYRMGVFQHLAQAALQGRLPEQVHPAQVRCALTRVLKNLMERPGTFTGSGWLQIGVAGHQNQMGEYYISTGSLYLCSTAFLPLGLPATHSFWASGDQPWTMKKIWEGDQLHADHAI